MPLAPDEKYCPECRSAYLPSASVCVDCDAELVWGSELPEEEVLELPPASELTCVRVAPLPWIRALSQGLQERGYDHRVEPASAADAPEGQTPAVFGRVALFGLYLREEDAPPARELDEGIAAQLLPDSAPALDEGESESCPACGASLAHDATECPDCELPFA